MRRRQADPTPLQIEIAVLHVARKHHAEGGGGFYAYGIARQLGDLSGRLLSSGTLYRALQRMVHHGWLEGQYEDAAVAEQDGHRPRRTLYSITDEGFGILKANLAEGFVTRPGAWTPDGNVARRLA